MVRGSPERHPTWMEAKQEQVIASLSLNVVHRRDRLLGIGIICVSDEAKASTATSVSIFDNHLKFSKMTGKVTNGVRRS